MGILDRVLEAFAYLERGQFENALLPTCSAFDATASKEFPAIKKNNEKCKAFLRQHMHIIWFATSGGVISVPPGANVSFSGVQAPIKSDGSGNHPMEDLIYDGLRCAMVHECEVAKYLQLVPEMTWGPDQNGIMRFPRGIVLGLLAAVIVTKANSDLLGKGPAPISELWGNQQRWKDLFKRPKVQIRARAVPTRPWEIAPESLYAGWVLWSGKDHGPRDSVV